MANELQLRRGTSASVTALLKKAGEPLMVTDLPGQIVLGIDGTASFGVVADKTKSAANEAAMLADVTTKQGDVVVLTDNDQVFKRVSLGNGLNASLIADWQRIGRAVDSTSVVHFGAVATDADAGGPLDEIWTDFNSTDWTGSGETDPDNPENIIIYDYNVVTCYNGTSQAWDYVGPKPVSIGTGGVVPTTPDPGTGNIPVLHTAIAADFQLSGAQNFDDVYEGVANDAAMVLLTAKQGDIAIQADGSTYKLSTQTPATIGDWVLLSSGSAVATSSVTVLGDAASGLAETPYVQGDVRVLEATVGTTLAGAYKATVGKTATGLDADWHQISWDDHGILA